MTADTVPRGTLPALAATDLRCCDCGHRIVGIVNDHGVNRAGERIVFCVACTRRNPPKTLAQVKQARSWRPAAGDHGASDAKADAGSFAAPAGGKRPPRGRRR